VAISGYPKLPASEAVLTFVNDFMIPYYNTQDSRKIRALIRDRPQLNELLFKNRAGLQWLYESLREPQSGVSLESAESLFAPGLEENGHELSRGQLQHCFLHSQMTILDDVKQSRKYSYVTHVEMLEMICRVAAMAIPVLETIEYKVHLLLRWIYDEFNVEEQPAPKEYKDLEMLLADVNVREPSESASQSHPSRNSHRSLSFQ
jgi:hypothetical protein